MIALEELTKLSIAEREEIIEALEQSIEADRGDFQESPELIAEILKRSARLKANPTLGSTWEQMEHQIRSSRA